MYRFFAVAALFCLGAGMGFASVDNGLLALVPANAKVVTSMDVQQARTSPFGQFLLSQTNANGQGFEEMARQTGFDPRSDLQTLMFASPGPSASPQSGFVVLMRGTFDAQRISNLILSKGGAVQTSDGVDIYVNTHKRNGVTTAFALPDTGIAVLGDLASVQQVIANRANPTVLDPDLQSLIANVSGANDAWFATVLGGSYLTMHINHATNQQAKPQAQALQSVRQAAGGLHFGSTVDFSFDAITRSPQDATALADVIHFLTSMVQLQTKNGAPPPAITAALQNMSLNTSGNTLQASLSIPEASMEQLVASDMQAHHGFKAAKPQ